MPTLSEYVEALAQAGRGLGGWFRFESTAAAVGADANRTVISSDLADDDDGTTLYQQGYLYATEGNVAGQQRRVSAFDGSTDSVGRFFSSAPFSAIPASGITWEFSAKLPRLQRGTTPGLREIVNQTLRMLWIEDRLTITGNGSYAYPITAYPWLTRQAQIGEVYDTTVASVNPYRSEKPRLRLDAEVPQLELRTSYSAAQTFDLQVWRPGNSKLRQTAQAAATISGGAVTAIAVVSGGYYTATPAVTISGGGGTGATATATLTGTAVTSIAVTGGGSGYTSTPTVQLPAGTWVEQTSSLAGLVSDADEAIAPIDDVVTVGLAYAYAALAWPNPGTSVSYWENKHREQALIAGAVKALSLPVDASGGRLVTAGGGYRQGLWP